MRKRKLIKNNNRVILLTFAQTVPLYPGVSFWCISDGDLLAQGDTSAVASGRCHGRCEEQQKGSLDKRFLCIWARVELDNSHSDRQWYLGQETTLCFLLPAISLCFFTPSLKSLDHAKSVWLRTLGCHSLGFGVCNSIRVTTLKADVFHSPLPLLLALPLPANRCRFLHFKAVDLPESFLHASNALCFRGLYLGPLIKLLNAALHMAHHQRRVAHAGTWKCRREKHLRGIGLCLHTMRQAKREKGGGIPTVVLSKQQKQGRTVLIV